MVEDPLFLNIPDDSYYDYSDLYYD